MCTRLWFKLRETERGREIQRVNDWHISLYHPCVCLSNTNVPFFNQLECRGKVWFWSHRLSIPSLTEKVNCSLQHSIDSIQNVAEVWKIFNARLIQPRRRCSSFLHCLVADHDLTWLLNPRLCLKSSPTRLPHRRRWYWLLICLAVKWFVSCP